MTIDINKLEALEHAATPGPWTKRDQAGGEPPEVRGQGGRLIAYCDEHDAACIAAMRNAMPELVAEYRRAQDQERHWKESAIKIADAAKADRDELLARLRAAETGLEAIRSACNDGNPCAIDMQLMAAEALFPGKFPTPKYILEEMRRAVEAGVIMVRSSGIVDMEAAGPVRAGAAIVAMDARRAETLTAIVRDLAAQPDPMTIRLSGHCWHCDRVGRHTESCPWRRAVEAVKP